MYFGIAFFMYLFMSFVVHYLCVVSIVSSFCIYVFSYVDVSPGRRFVRSVVLSLCMYVDPFYVYLVVSFFRSVGISLFVSLFVYVCRFFFSY